MRKIFYSFFICIALWLSGLLWFVQTIPTASASLPVSADAIIVLTGGKGRLEHGLQLLADRKAPVLFISGVGKNVTVGDLLLQARGELGKTIRKLPESAIILGREAENTIGNAEETARWIQSRKPKSIILVTANYHMPRSISEFTELMPDLTLHTSPVFPDDFDLSRWWLNADNRSLVLSEYHKYIAGKLRHALISGGQA